MAVPWQRLWSTGFVWVLDFYCSINKRFVKQEKSTKVSKKIKKRGLFEAGWGR